MIYLYSGTPGSGKSLDTARVIYNELKRNHIVVSNIEIARGYVPHADSLVYFENNFLNPKCLIKISQFYFKNSRIREGKLLLVIDECQLLFNAREWNKPERKDWLSFFTHHRHYGYDIILVAQFDRMIDRQIRSLVEYEIIHRKVSNFGLKGYLLCGLTGFRQLFCRVKVWYPMREKVSSSYFHSNKKYYRIYDTYACIDEVENKKT